MQLSSEPSKHGIATAAVAGIIIVILVVAGVAVYYTATSKSTTTVTATSVSTSTATSTATSSVTSTVTTSSSSSSAAAGTPYSSPKNSSLLVDESNAATPDSLDPQYGFFEQDQTYLNGVFQDLVGYNGSSSNSDQIVDVEASNVVVANNSQEYIFTIRPDVYFSNGDNVTAYTLWFTYVRELYMNAPSAVGYSNFNLITMNVGTDWFYQTCSNQEPWGLVNAVNSVMGVALTAKNCGTLANDLNSLLSNFNPSNSQTQAIMAYAHQAYSAPNATTFIIRTMSPYGLLEQDIAGFSGSHTVDPAFVDAHGGVQNNTANGYLNVNCEPGTGPYVCQSVATGVSEVVLVKNPDYWAAGSGPNGLKTGLPWSIKPASIPVVDIEYAVTGTPLYEDFGTNVAALSGAGIPEWSQMYAAYGQKNVPLSDIIQDVGASDFVFYLAQNSQRFPTNNTDFREAVYYATNYTALLDTEVVYNGTDYGQVIIGPATPGYGDLYNPGNLSLPSQDLNTAATYLNEAGQQLGFYVTMPNGTVLGDAKGSQLAPLTFDYIVPLSPSVQEQLTIFQQSLAAIGIPITLVGETSAVYDTQALSPTTAPLFTSLGWGIDYPDVWLQQYVCFYTSACNLPTYINNATLTSFVQAAAFNPNPTAQLAADKQLYQLSYDQAWYVWLPWPHTVFWREPYLQGIAPAFNLYTGLSYNLLSYST